MRAVEKFCEHEQASTHVLFCEQFEQRPTFASTSKLNETILYPSHGNTSAYDLKDGSRFPKRLSLQCVLLFVGSVIVDVLEQNCAQPCRWKWRIQFCGRYFCYFFYLHDSGFQCASAWAIATSRNLMWMLFVDFPDEMWMLQQPNMKLSPSSSSSSKKEIQVFDKTSSTTGWVQPPCFRKFRSNDTVQSISFPWGREKGCSFICPEQTTENSIQMVSAPGSKFRAKIRK